jgi:hypothetical protein
MWSKRTQSGICRCSARDSKRRIKRGGQRQYPLGAPIARASVCSGSELLQTADPPQVDYQVIGQPSDQDSWIIPHFIITILRWGLNTRIVPAQPGTSLFGTRAAPRMRRGQGAGRGRSVSSPPPGARRPECGAPAAGRRATVTGGVDSRWHILGERGWPTSHSPQPPTPHRFP